MPTTSPIRTIRRTLAVAAGTLLLVGLTACAPATDTGAELKTDNTQMSIDDWRQQMDDCMKDAGFDLGDPTTPVDTSQFDMNALNKASQDCTAEVGEPPVDENMPTDEEFFETQLIFAKCMRDAGYDYPDPVKGSNMSASFGSDTDPEVVDACSAKANEETAK